jgi:hypothetical protein
VTVNFNVTSGLQQVFNRVGVKFSAGVNDTGNAPLVVDTFAKFGK